MAYVNTLYEETDTTLARIKWFDDARTGDYESIEVTVNMNLDED